MPDTLRLEERRRGCFLPTAQDTIEPLILLSLLLHVLGYAPSGKIVNEGKHP